MTYYCSVADVGSRIGLDSQQRVRAESRIIRHIRQSTIYIDQEFLSYGRTEPSKSTADSTLNGAVTAGATTVTVISGTAFSNAGSGNIDGDTFSWTGKSTHQLTGVTGVSFDHSSGVAVQEGAFAHILREICADLAAAGYLEDEGTLQTGADGGLRGQTLRDRGTHCLQRLAHLGSV
tara:strand:- start:12846 stop:13376 length:531 start_codon:yes stop_codon:yes gene_type:complete